MYRVIVGSTNPVKVESVRRAFERAFGQSPCIQGLAVPSGVADQPLTDEATRTGARNRARAVRQQQPEADFWVGVEGGVDYRHGYCEAFGWIAVRSERQECLARSAAFPLPETVGQRLRAGEELGPLIDQLFEEHNSKQKGGAIGLLSGGIVSREDLYFQPLLFALLPSMQPALYDE